MSESRFVGRALRLRAFIALGVVTLVFSVLSPEFLTTGNLSILVKHVAINAILSIGMTFVILSGGIDLSVGSIVGFSGMVAGFLLSRGLVLAPLDIVVYPHAWFVVVLALLAGMTIGAINGWVVSRLGVAPFIATLGSMYVARGAALLVSDGATFPNLAGEAGLGNTGFPWIGAASIAGLPVPVSLMAVLAGGAIFLAARTPFGRHVYAVGGNERAATLSGVRVAQVRLRVYVMSGFCAALVGLIIAAQLGAAHPATGNTFELNAIAAVVLGGTSLMGGRGTVGGTLIGAFVIGVLADGLVLLGVSEFWQMVVKGLVIVLAVILDQVQKRSS
ncbi:MAG TPA: ABC transporter permease [Vicinamibacterales bacterium]|jgi:erythritol transport system permease protein